jgi:hypothetical protein
MNLSNGSTIAHLLFRWHDFDVEVNLEEFTEGGSFQFGFLCRKGFSGRARVIGPSKTGEYECSRFQ